jgi:hypothetical protein
MENDNVRTVQNLRLGFIEQLMDIKELESRQAPSEAVITTIKPVVPA